MNQELATQNNTEAVTPAMPGQTAGTKALQNLEQQAKAMGNAFQIAEAMCKTDMVPKQYRNKPEDGAAAILYGAELGLNAIQSLQQVMVINGKPGVEARTMVALLRSQGYRFDVEENTDEAVTVTGVSPTGEEYTARWTYDMAKKAGYTSNKLYQQIPASMLYAKAATEVCRRLGSHVLSGIQYSTEELQLQPMKATSERLDKPARGRGADAVRAALEAKKAKPEPAAEAEKSDAERAKDSILAAQTVEKILEITGWTDKNLDEFEAEEVSHFAQARIEELENK